MARKEPWGYLRLLSFLMLAMLLGYYIGGGGGLGGGMGAVVGLVVGIILLLYEKLRDFIFRGSAP